MGAVIRLVSYMHAGTNPHAAHGVYFHKKVLKSNNTLTELVTY
jgi:hypothetical protein